MTFKRSFPRGSSSCRGATHFGYRRAASLRHQVSAHAIEFALRQNLELRSLRLDEQQIRDHVENVVYDHRDRSVRAKVIPPLEPDTETDSTEVEVPLDKTRQAKAPQYAQVWLVMAINVIKVRATGVFGRAQNRDGCLWQAGRRAPMLWPRSRRLADSVPGLPLVHQLESVPKPYIGRCRRRPVRNVV